MSTSIIKRMSLAICLLFFLLTSFSSEATHFYGGQLKWQQDGGNRIRFTFTSTWRRDFPFSGYGPGNLPEVGEVLPNVQSLNTGHAGNLIAVTPQVTAVNALANQMITTWTGTYTYPTAGNYTAIWSLCCRISSLLDLNADDQAILTTTVNVGSPFNNPPVAS